jgi:hypothetical protein
LSTPTNPHMFVVFNVNDCCEFSRKRGYYEIILKQLLVNTFLYKPRTCGTVIAIMLALLKSKA